VSNVYELPRARSTIVAIRVKSRSWASTGVTVPDATAAIMQSTRPRGVTPAGWQLRKMRTAPEK
jgi:hypothetical protein